MLTKIHEAIQTLERYKYSKLACEFAEKFPFESKRREAYLNNLSYQLNLFLRKPIASTLKFVIDEIKNTLKNDQFGIDQQSKIVFPTADLYNKLSYSLKLVENYYRQLASCEADRIKVRNAFVILPKLIGETSHEFLNIINYIEEQFLIKKSLNSQLSISQETENKFEFLLNAYFETKNLHHLEYNSHILSSPLNLFFEPSSETLHHYSYFYNELFFYQIIMNLALYLYHFNQTLISFKTSQSISDTKNNIRFINRIFHYLQSLFKEFLNSKNQYHAKIVKLNRQNVLYLQGDIVNLLRLYDRVAGRLLKLNDLLAKAQSAAVIIFAYVWDENINNLRDRTAKSRLEKLLNGLYFEPLTEEDIHDASQKYTLKLAMSLNYSANKNLTCDIKAVNS